MTEQENTLRQEEEAVAEAASTDGVHAPEPGPQADAEQQAAERVEEDLDELRARAAERDEYLALAQRTQADFENYRKRMAKETAAARDRGVKQVVEELLPALDNFERALAHAEEEEQDEAHSL